MKVKGIVGRIAGHRPASRHPAALRSSLRPRGGGAAGALWVGTPALALLMTLLAGVASASPAGTLSSYDQHLDRVIVDYYTDPASVDVAKALRPPADLMSAIDPAIAGRIKAAWAKAPQDPPTAVATIRALLQQACTLEVAQAVKAGDLEKAKRWRADLLLPQGVSAKEGTLLLQTLGSRPDKRADAARLLVREAITWQTTRVRQLLAEVQRLAKGGPKMPGRLREHVAEAATLAKLPPAIAAEAGMDAPPALDSGKLAAARAAVTGAKWDHLADAFAPLREMIETSLPSLLTAKERARYERLMLKLVKAVPSEYSAGVRGGKVAVALEYHEAVTFTRQARQLFRELAPLWLKDQKRRVKRATIEALDGKLATIQKRIDAVAPPGELKKSVAAAVELMEHKLGISLALHGTTAQIVDEVMLQTRRTLNQSLAAALAGQWTKAERLRLEAYTTYDPALEARLMPRDPQLARNIESLFLDGLDKPGVKAMLDRRAPAGELQAAYGRVSDGLARAGALLKSGVSPVAAFINAGGIVLREGLEGLLVIVAVFAGLAGKENAGRRRLVWLGVALAMVATAVTWLISQTIITSLSAYAETIEAVTGVLAIVVLLLITNWLFQQVYWKQWVTTLKNQARGDTAWQLIMVGFAVGYREGFETVLFLQNLVLDAGGVSVGAGVAIAGAGLVALGVAALWLGMKLPYMKLLLFTAGLIGFVLITFTGGTVRSIQTVGWLPVHKIMPVEWPAWMGTWLGMYNTWESIAGQLLACGIVLGTWRISRWRAKRRSARRRRQFASARAAAPRPGAAIQPPHRATS